MSDIFIIKCRGCGGPIPITEVRESVYCPRCGNRIRINWSFKDPEPEDKAQQSKSSKDDEQR